MKPVPAAMFEMNMMTGKNVPLLIVAAFTLRLISMLEPRCLRCGSLLKTVTGPPFIERCKECGLAWGVKP